jgi:hypothetical protein
MKTLNQQPADKMELAKKFAAQRGLDNASKKAFIKLCQNGCDPKILSDKLSVLGAKKRFSVIRELGEGETKRVHKKTTTLRPLDSFEIALGGLKVKNVSELKEDLASLQKTLLEVARRIETLNYAPIMSGVNVNPPLDTFSIPETLIRYAKQVIPLVIKHSKHVGVKQSPDFNQHLIELIEHVEKSTGEPNYKLVCDLLEGIEHYTNVEALGQRIYRQRSTKRGNVK